MYSRLLNIPLRLNRGIFAFEIKRTEHISRQDLKGPRAFLTDYPEAKVYLLYSGTRQS